MRYIIITITAILYISTTSAQNISTGLRSGISNVFDASELCNGENNITWDKEGFIRYETKGKFAFETRFNHYSFKYATPAQNIVYFDLPEYYLLGGVVTSNNYVFGASAQYDISCPHMKEHCTIMKNIKSYIGIDIALRYTYENTIHNAVLTSNGELVKREKKNSYLDYLVGLSHTTIYKLGEHVNLIGTARLMVDPNDLESSSSYTGSHLSLLIGAGYTF